MAKHPMPGYVLGGSGPSVYHPEWIRHDTIREEPAREEFDGREVIVWKFDYVAQDGSTGTETIRTFAPKTLYDLIEQARDELAAGDVYVDPIDATR